MFPPALPQWHAIVLTLNSAGWKKKARDTQDSALQKFPAAE
jgi:hypothetical protein